LRILVGLMLLISGSAMANRCEWHPVLHKSVCCAGDEQAIWEPTFNRMRCFKSQTGDSCAWSPVFHQTKCCGGDHHAVWNELFSKLECFEL